MGKMLRDSNGELTEWQAMKTMKKKGPPTRLGKAQTRQKHRKPSVIGEDVADVHFNVEIKELLLEFYSSK